MSQSRCDKPDWLGSRIMPASAGSFAVPCRRIERNPIGMRSGPGPPSAKGHGACRVCALVRIPAVAGRDYANEAVERIIREEAYA
jgi:hypothetical protein